VVVLQQDNYYRDYPGMPFAERVKVNFDHPDSMDTPLLAENVRRLRAGQAIERPTYDYSNFQRLHGTVRIEPRAAIIVEGILIFENKALRELLDIKIFVDGAAHAPGVCRAFQALRGCDYS
jgi:uridine kinase